MLKFTVPDVLFDGSRTKSPSKGSVKLMQPVKIAHSFLRYVSNLFHFIILSLPM